MKYEIGFPTAKSIEVTFRKADGEKVPLRLRPIDVVDDQWFEKFLDGKELFFGDDHRTRILSGFYYQLDSESRAGFRDLLGLDMPVSATGGTEGFEEIGVEIGHLLYSRQEFQNIYDMMVELWVQSNGIKKEESDEKSAEPVEEAGTTVKKLIIWTVICASLCGNLAWITTAYFG